MQKTILVVTKNSDVELDILRISKEIPEMIIKISQDMKKKDDFDAILVSKDMLNNLNNHPDWDNFPPVLLIFNGESIKDDYDSGISDYLDITKLTANGLIRAISSCIEKHKIVKDLNAQRKILNGLINDVSSKNNIDKSIYNPEVLLGQNQKLIKKIMDKNKDLKKMTATDSLTGAGNKRFFDQMLDACISKSKRSDQLFGLLFLDLNKFKKVNDDLGHQAGDILLANVSKRILKTIRKEDFFFRIGGDEFAIILSGIKSVEDCGIVSWRISQEIEKPFYIQNKEINIGISIGISSFPFSGENKHELIRSADQAMYASKNSSEKYIYAGSIFSNDDVKKINLEKRASNYIKKNKICISYLPVISVVSGDFSGFEVVITRESGHGSVRVSDQSDVLYELSVVWEWIFESICVHLIGFCDNQKLPFKIYIDLFPFFNMDAISIKKINDLFCYFEFPLTSMEFFIKDICAMKKIFSKNIENGVDEILKKINCTIFKIDSFFISEYMDDDKVSFFKNMHDISSRFNLKLMADGVSSESDKKNLLSSGCKLIEGDLISCPLSPDRLENFIKKQNMKTLVMSRTEILK